MILNTVLLSLAVISPNFLKEVEAIIGGENANAGQFPYITGLFITKSDGTYFCGGTILTNRWLITAGQCVNGATSFEINLGSHLLDGDVNKQTLVTATFTLHPDYDMATMQHDIGLVKFRLPITFTDYIKSISLGAETIADGSSVVAIGWGETIDFDHSPVNHLQHVQLQTLANSVCQAIYGSQITDEMLCAIGQTNEGICHGDVGGPLIDPSTSAIIGVATFLSGNGCYVTHPSGFMRVASYHDWIIENIAED